MFTVRTDGGSADVDQVLARLVEARPKHAIEWRVEASLDRRKGEVVVQNSAFASHADFELFRQSPAHLSLTAYLARCADWVVADYEE